MLEKAKADPEKRKLMQDREDAARNYANDISQAKKEGEKIAKVEAARKMLHGGLSIELVAKYSGLSIEDVSSLVH